MKKVVKTYWQILIFPILYIPYSILNTKVIVKWLGCGCPTIDENGQTMKNTFNANTFTLFFWGIIAFIVIVISWFNMRNLTERRHKLIYMISIVAVSIFLAFLFYYSMLWRKLFDKIGWCSFLS